MITMQPGPAQHGSHRFITGRASAAVRLALASLAILSVLAVWTSPALAAGAVTADPVYVTITKPDQSVTIKLLLDGKPLPAAAIKGAKYMASDHDYARMFSFTKKDGEVTVTPTKLLEVGSYTLVLNTAHGPVSVEILAPLTDLPDTLEKQAATLGITVDELKAKMGLSRKMKRETLSIDLPVSYVEGQTLNVTLEPNPKRIFIWSINDKVIKQGAGENTFSYTFDNPGKYTFKVEEKEGDTVVASATSATEVTAPPPVRWDATVGDSRVLDGPKGYSRYTWSMNGKRVSDGLVLKLTFTDPGKYTIECRAEDPTDKAAAKSRHLVYEVTVKQKGQ
ncbi:MAG: hypothetical protein HZB26_05880 [Candidatus Hydrogenedentes bacterium]|nr:hypothetical protein [Candidatus Hydrogenedentota bacterium]